MHYELHILTSLLSSSLPYVHFLPIVHSLFSLPSPFPPSSTNSNPFSYLPVFTPFQYSSHLPFYLYYLLFILVCFLSTSLLIFTTPPPPSSSSLPSLPSPVLHLHSHLYPLPFFIFTPIFTLSRSSSSLPSLPSPVLHLHSHHYPLPFFIFTSSLSFNVIPSYEYAAVHITNYISYKMGLWKTLIDRNKLLLILLILF